MSELLQRTDELAPETCLPVQYFPLRNGLADGPEGRLLLAVVEAAYLALFKGKPHVRREARRWFLSGRAMEDRSFTFDQICDVFGWSARRWKEAILHGRISPVPRTHRRVC
jgi:hypothetical protein